jgi:ankyrin repeat protein
MANIFNLLLDPNWSTVKEQMVIKFIKDNPDCLNKKTEVRLRTPLMIACQNGLLEIVKVMLSHKININEADKRGETPLMFASSEGHLKVVIILLEHGAEINNKNKLNETALIVAAHDIHTEVVRELILRGADKTVKDVHNRTACDLALKIIDNGEIIDLLN